MAAYDRLFRLGAGYSGYQIQYSIDKGRELKDVRISVNRTFLPAKVFYFLFCGSMVSFSPFVPVYMEQLGLNSLQVGMIKAVPPIGTLVVCPIWGGVTDAFSVHKSSILAGIGIGGVAMGATYFTPSARNASSNATGSTTTPPWDDWDDSTTTTFSVMMSLMIVSVVFTAHVMPTVNYAVMQLVEIHGGTDYGKQRLWGAVGWGSVSGITGFLIDSYKRSHPQGNRFLPAYVIFASLMLPALIPILCMQFPPHQRPASISRGILGLLTNLDILIFLFICAVAGMSLGVINTFQFIFLQSLEAPNVVMGLTLTFTCLSEIPFMYLSDRVILWLGEELVFVIAILCYTLRFILYYLLRNPWMILPIELLHGICFGALYPVMMSYAHRISPPGMESTVQNIMSAASKGVGSAVGTIAGGYVYDRCGPRRLFLYCSVICGATTVFFAVYTALTRLISRCRRQSVTYEEL